MNSQNRSSTPRKYSKGLITASLSIALLCGIGFAMAQDTAFAASNSADAKAWSPDADCAACHEVESSSFIPAEAAETDGAPAKKTDAPLATHHAGVDCMSCHNDVEGLTEAHEKATGPKKIRRLKWTTIDNDTCLSCHTSWEQLAEQTEEATVLTDKKGKTVNPHGAPQTHIAVDKPYLSCSNCHDMHNGKDTDEASVKTCASCHHADVYECNTCH